MVSAANSDSGLIAPDEAADVPVMPVEPEAKPARKRRRWPLKFRLLDLIWMSLLAAVLMSWHRDRVRMKNELDLLTGVRSNTASWSIDQILGKPDTVGSGDMQTAWASKSQESPEWVIVEFPRAVDISQVVIYETYNPGAVYRICTLSYHNQETEIWKGTDPTPTTAARGNSHFGIKPGNRSRRLKIYLQSELVPGWNEIDAVRLDGTNRSTQWASAAWASSSFGKNNEAPTWFWP
jgi:hypothetical protein